MQTIELSKNIEHFIGQLTDYQKIKLFEFFESMTTETKKAKRDISKFAGSIDHDDLELMEQAIAHGCEKIDADEWYFYFGHEYLCFGKVASYQNSKQRCSF